MTTRTTDPRRGRLDRTVIRLTGENVRTFANGMFTNNTRDLPVGAHQSTAFADDRGRLKGLADLWCEADDRLLLALDGLDADGFSELFRIHLMLDDIDVEAPPLFAWFAEQPGPEGRWRPWLDGFFGIAADVGGAEIPPEECLWRRIAAGVPSFADASAKQLPHELALRDTHLHFEKGCYRGQEIIHRIDVMGGVRKALTGVQLSGTPDTDELRNGSKKVGRLGSRVEHPELGWIGLAVVRNEHRDPGTVLTLGEVTATVCSLPIA